MGGHSPNTPANLSGLKPTWKVHECATIQSAVCKAKKRIIKNMVNVALPKLGSVAGVAGPHHYSRGSKKGKVMLFF